VGETVVYTFTVINDGDVGDGSPVSDVYVSDDVAGDATYVTGDDGEDGMLEVGETWVFTASYTIQEGDPNPLVNVGTVMGQDRDSAEVSASDTHSTAIAQPGPALHTVLLPLVTRGHSSEALAPDLVVERITVTGESVQVVIKNQGDGPVTAEKPFWVDLYVNPHPVPTMVNQTWGALCSEGMVWGVEGAVLPLEPGEELTLTMGDSYYHSNLSTFSGTFAAGMPIYVQVDSANAGTTCGAVLESHEIAGGTYNNIRGPVYLTGAASDAMVTTEPPGVDDVSAGSVHRLPPRP
jgi:hypothetical protein